MNDESYQGKGGNYMLSNLYFQLHFNEWIDVQREGAGYFVCILFTTICNGPRSELAFGVQGANILLETVGLVRKNASIKLHFNEWIEFQ